MTQQPSDRSIGGIGEAAEVRLLERFEQREQPTLEVVNDDLAAINEPWQINTTVIRGAAYVLASRRSPIKSEVLSQVDANSYNTDRRKVVLGKNAVAMLCQPPLQQEDVAAVLSLERSVEVQSTGTERVASSLKERLTARQKEVTKHITHPINEIAKMVDISEMAARAAVDAARSRSRLGSKRRFMSQALIEEMVDISELSTVSTINGPLTPSQKEYLINDCLADSEKTTEFTREVLRVLGAQTTYEAFAMAVRDKLINIQPLIPNTAPPTK